MELNHEKTLTYDTETEKGRGHTLNGQARGGLW